MDRFKGKTVIINAIKSAFSGEIEYSISIDGRVQVSSDKVKWDATVRQLRDAGAAIVDNAAIKAEQDAAIKAMQARMRASK